MDALEHFDWQERFHTHRCVDCGEAFSCCGELCADSEWALCRDCALEREAEMEREDERTKELAAWLCEDRSEDFQKIIQAVADQGGFSICEIDEGTSCR